MIKFAVLAGVCAVLLVVALGVYLFAKGARNVERGIASSGWPTTTGTVVQSRTAENTNRDRKTGNVSVTYSTETVVRYSVSGQEYSTNVIHFGQTLGSGDASEAELQRVRYPEGAEVRVSYDPRQHWIAAIRPGLHPEAFWLPGAGLAFILPAVMCLILMASMSGDTSAPHQIPTLSLELQGNRAMAIVAGIFASIFCCLGLLALTSGLQRMWLGYASLRWPRTAGAVVFSKVKADEVTDSTEGRRSSTYSPQFVYSYEVDGATHFNNVRRFGRLQGQDAEWADEIASRYPRGGKVHVAYLPADPDVAVLEPGNNSEAFWLPGIGLAALGFGLVVFLWIVPSIARLP